MTHLIFDYMTAILSCGENRHAQEVMKELGITYVWSTPQSISESFWFWRCENIPEVLPKYLRRMEETDPRIYIGWGLSKELADYILNYNKNQVSLEDL